MSYIKVFYIFWKAINYSLKQKRTFIGDDFRIRIESERENQNESINANKKQKHKDYILYCNLIVTRTWILMFYLWNTYNIHPHFWRPRYQIKKKVDTVNEVLWNNV